MKGLTMALIQCPECGKHVSDRAAACPECAYPINAQRHGHPVSRQAGEVTGQGAAGNVLAAVLSFFIPGLGQLTQGRLGSAVLMFFSAFLLWFVLLGWIVHLIAAINAANWKRR
jgi:hypothetical protein